MCFFKAIIAILIGLTVTSASHANTDQQKIYKGVFGGDKPKCIACHVDKTPKKEDGKHELNEYGKKVAAIQEKLDAESYKKAGPLPE